jgi:GH35 family endo-1,4-beta-xylanase
MPLKSSATIGWRPSPRDFLYTAAMTGVAFALGEAAPRELRAQSQPAGVQFPYGAIHMSTTPHWQHYLPLVNEWASYLDEDVAKMKSVDFNTLAAHIDWYDIEVAPGRFEFDRVDKLLDVLEKHDMKALLWPWPELQPDWVIKAFPDAGWLASDGFRPGIACWDHPEVRSHIERSKTGSARRRFNRGLFSARWWR